jgi:tetratricopeptide (TPR) repeat protein
MRHPIRSVLLILAGALLVSACATPAPQPSGPSPDEIIASIRAAGRGDDSVVQVHPLRDPRTDAWLSTARRKEAAGQYAQAAKAMDQALAVSPDAPDLLQERAELAIRLHRFDQAEQLARRSFQLGPRVGSLCARNWQTVLELRRLDHDAAGVQDAQEHLRRCHVSGPIRM